MSEYANSVQFGGELVRILGLDEHTFSVTLRLDVGNFAVLTTKRYVQAAEGQAITRLLERYRLIAVGEPEEVPPPPLPRNPATERRERVTEALAVLRLAVTERQIAADWSTPAGAAASAAVDTALRERIAALGAAVLDDPAPEEV